MALFTTNYKDLGQHDLIPAGQYECFITDTHPDSTPGGTEYISMNLRIRKDLDKALPNTNGKQHNRVIFANIWRRKATGKYSSEDLNCIMRAAGYPEKTVVKSWDDWTKKLVGKPVRVTVSITKDTYKGETRERNQIWPNTFRPTNYPLQGGEKQEDPFKGATGDAADDEPTDLPF